ncbi:hypothetical protein D3C84_1111290 [compost metagenome]
MLLFMWDWRILGMKIQNTFQFIHPVFYDTVIARFYIFPILRSDGRKSLESIKADDFTVVVEWFVDTS